MVNIIQKYGQSIKVNRQQVNINVYVKVFCNHCCAEKYMDFFWHLLIFVLTFTFYVSIFLYLSVINFTFHQGFSNREKANSLKSRTQSLVKSSLVTLFHIELFYAAIYSGCCLTPDLLISQTSVVTVRLKLRNSCIKSSDLVV